MRATLLMAAVLPAALMAPLCASAQTPITPQPVAVAPEAVSQSVTPDEVVAPWRATRWALLGGGVAALLAGSMVWGMGNDDEAELTSKTSEVEGGRVVGITQVEALRLQDSATRLKSAGATGMVIGSTLLVGGLITWLLEPDLPAYAPVKEDAPEPAVRPFSLLPTVGPDGPGLVFGLQF
jgi:hypothetical protein